MNKSGGKIGDKVKSLIYVVFSFTKVNLFVKICALLVFFKELDTMKTIENKSLLGGG